LGLNRTSSVHVPVPDLPPNALLNEPYDGWYTPDGGSEEKEEKPGRESESWKVYVGGYKLKVQPPLLTIGNARLPSAECGHTTLHGVHDFLFWGSYVAAGRCAQTPCGPRI
jgi:hypothetical protein